MFDSHVALLSRTESGDLGNLIDLVREHRLRWLAGSDYLIAVEGWRRHAPGHINWEQLRCWSFDRWRDADPESDQVIASVARIVGVDPDSPDFPVRAARRFREYTSNHGPI